MGYHSNDNDTYDSEKADPDIKRIMEQKNVPLKPEEPSVQVYCRGKLANGQHDFVEISEIEKSGYVKTDGILGFQGRKKVFYIETVHKCEKCGAKYIGRWGKKRSHWKYIPAEHGGKFDSPARTIDLSKGASILYPGDSKYFDSLPSGVEAYEWLG